MVPHTTVYPASVDGRFSVSCYLTTSLKDSLLKYCRDSKKDINYVLRSALEQYLQVEKEATNDR